MKKLSILVLLLSTSAIIQTEAAQLNPNDPVKLMVVNELRSGRSKKDSKVDFVVTENITNQHGDVLISKGTPAYGKVVNSRHAGAWGRRGVLEVEVTGTTTIDGQNVPLRATASKKGPGNKQLVHLGAWLVAWPIAMVRGKNVVMPAGTEITAFVDRGVEVALNNQTAPRALKNTSQFISLKDGNKFKGSVVNLENGIYTISTNDGTYKIPSSSIASISNDQS